MANKNENGNAALKQDLLDTLQELSYELEDYEEGLNPDASGVWKKWSELHKRISEM